jgi:mono/diheme cytochrome c family protein/glucose/arabinose dehydrogenase
MAVIVATLSTGYGFQATRSWPPGVQPVSEQSPALSAEDELKTFHMPPGYRVELVASEPMIQDAVAIDWDTSGRLWAVEMPGYMLDIQAAREHEPLGRVVVLEDTNGDGTMDKRTVSADGLVLPRALKVLARGVLVGEPPNLWLMRDTDGDLRMDAKELVSNTYGRLEANVEHNANSLTWALDNWIHTSEVDMRLRLKNGTFEVEKTLPRGQWGASQDDTGRLYRNTNESALHVDIVPTPYFLRNPNLVRTRGSYESLNGETNEVNTVWPIRPTRGVNRGYQTGILRADGTLSRFTAVSAPTVFRGDRLPAELYGNVFVVEPAGNLVSRIIISDDGTTLRARKAYDRGEFLASTDERFRPVNLSSAPDGTLYVVDLYRGIIQHKGYITEYLRDQILSRKLEQPTGYGRIFRIVHDTTRRDSNPSLSKATPASLVETLSHPNGWWRDTAQRLLVERGDTSVVESLKRLAASAPEPRTRLHALWTLDGIDSIDPAMVVQALGDGSRDVRASAIRLSERWLREPNHPLQAEVVKRLADTDWAVRRQLAASLGELPQGPKETALATLLERHGNDPIALDAAVSGLKGSEAAVLETLIRASAETPQRDAAITVLAATIVARGDDASVQAVFDRVADDARPDWQRSALLRGAEAALLLTTLPGSRTRNAGVAPSGTEPPGARGGPGGAPAFPRNTGTPSPAARGARQGAARGGGRGNAPALKLTREPALAALASRDRGDLGKRATSVLARLEWPGRPGAAAAVTPLTPEEQKRFAAGRDVYQNLCQACHQPDGRGLENLGSSLVGSDFALGSPPVSIRILLNGKEGTVGLMPPLGGMLSDDQIADVLTYIRREWGHTASPVNPATVKETRPLTAGRTRPWTNDELAKIKG